VGFAAEGCASYTRKQIDELTEFVKRPQVGAKGLVWIRVDEAGNVKSSIGAKTDTTDTTVYGYINTRESAISSKIDSVKSELMNYDSGITSTLSDEIKRATATEASIQISINTKADELNTSITQEVTRATEKENEIKNELQGEIDALSEQVKKNTNDIAYSDTFEAAKKLVELEGDVDTVETRINALTLNDLNDCTDVTIILDGGGVPVQEAQS
jgi:hypothetical protein